MESSKAQSMVAAMALMKEKLTAHLRATYLVRGTVLMMVAMLAVHLVSLKVISKAAERAAAMALTKG